MKLVIDTNIIIAAMVKDGLARKIIFFGNVDLISPEFTMEEVYKHRDIILDKAHFTEEEFRILFLTILGRVKIIPKSRYISFLREADSLIGKIDYKDVPFLALSLAVRNDGVWSDDKHFKKQNKIRVLTTKEIIGSIQKIS